MTPQDAYDLLRQAIPLRPELRFKSWPDNIPYEMLEKIGPYTGACYIATQVFCHLIPEAKPYCDPTRNHFWAQVDNEVWDATSDQFDFVFPYKDGKRTSFKQMSKRSKLLLNEVSVLVESHP